MEEKIYEDVHNYTKFKLVEMLIEKYKDNIVIRETTSIQKCQEISNEIFKELNLT